MVRNWFPIVKPAAPRGFEFVEMLENENGDTDIEAMNGKDFEGRTLHVNETRPREERGAGSSACRTDV